MLARSCLGHSGVRLRVQQKGGVPAQPCVPGSGLRCRAQVIPGLLVMLTWGWLLSPAQEQQGQSCCIECYAEHLRNVLLLHRKKDTQRKGQEQAEEDSEFSDDEETFLNLDDTLEGQSSSWLL